MYIGLVKMPEGKMAALQVSGQVETMSRTLSGAQHGGSEFLTKVLRPGTEPAHFYTVLPSTSTALRDLWLLFPSTCPHNHQPFTLKWLKIVS